MILSCPARSEGAQVRMCPVPVPAGKRGGIFNRVDGEDEEITAKSKKLARQVEKTLASNYGVVAPAYLSELVAERSAISQRVHRIVDLFVERVGADSDPWERRFAEKFGIILAAAILLAEWKIAPWNKKRAWQAIKSIYRRSRAAIVSLEDVKSGLLSRLGRLVEKGERFPFLSRKGQLLSAKQAARAWGIIKKDPQAGSVVLIPYARIMKLVGPAAIAAAVLAQLAKDGIVIPSSDGKLTRQTMIKALTDTRRRRYVYFCERAIRDPT